MRLMVHSNDGNDRQAFVPVHHRTKALPVLVGMRWLVGLQVGGTSSSANFWFRGVPTNIHHLALDYKNLGGFTISLIGVKTVNRWGDCLKG